MDIMSRALPRSTILPSRVLARQCCQASGTSSAPPRVWAGIHTCASRTRAWTPTPTRKTTTYQHNTRTSTLSCRTPRALQCRQQIRLSSHSPMGLPATNPRKKVTLQTLNTMYRKHEPITMLTAYDFPSAHVADHAGIDMILVGDSLAMVSLGLEDTSEVTMEEMIFASRAVSRATRSAFVVGDLPMGTYEVSHEQAVKSAIEMVKKGRAHSVKLEGGREMAPTIAAITRAGIPVLAHVGLTPQRQNALGGFRVQGKTARSAMALLDDAIAVQEAGAFGVVLEAIPPEIATIITSKLSIPTIGIGAGNGCSGQVLVQVDMLGNYPPGRYLPKFVKKYGDVWSEAHRAVEQYKNEVKDRSYPSKDFCYEVKPEVVTEFKKLVASRFGSEEGHAPTDVEGLGATAVAA